MKTPPRIVAALTLLATAVGTAASAGAADVRGSLRSMKNQHGVAVEEGYSFLRTERQVEKLADAGKLERLESNENYLVHAQVTHPYARPEVRLLIERLSAQYRAATGERLVVTSLVRPIGEQPSNAHRLSVHPAGMAVDLRVPADPESRAWLQNALVGMERSGLLDVTREYRPPHYHVAVFPTEYLAYVERREAEAAAQAAAAPVTTMAEAAAEPIPAAPLAPVAQATPVDVAAAQEEGGLRGALMLLLGTGLVAIPLARRRRGRQR